MSIFRKKSQAPAEVNSIAPSQADTLINEVVPQSATGQDQAPYKPSGILNSEITFGDNYVQHLPHNFRDDTIIPVPVSLRVEEDVPQ